MAAPPVFQDYWLTSNPRTSTSMLYNTEGAANSPNNIMTPSPASRPHVLDEKSVSPLLRPTENRIGLPPSLPPFPHESARSASLSTTKTTCSLSGHFSGAAINDNRLGRLAQRFTDDGVYTMNLIGHKNLFASLTGTTSDKCAANATVVHCPDLEQSSGVEEQESYISSPLLRPRSCGVEEQESHVSSPLLRPKTDGRLGSTSRPDHLFLAIGAATMALQTAVFVTMETVSLKFPNMTFSFLAHEVFAVSFFLTTTTFACLPSRFLFSTRLLTNMNVMACVSAFIFPVIFFAGSGSHWALVIILVLVGISTVLSVIMTPVVFSTAAAISHGTPVYAAAGQGLGTLFLAITSAIFVYTLSRMKFIIGTYFIAFTLYGISLASIAKLQADSQAVRRLRRFSETTTRSATRCLRHGRNSASPMGTRRAPVIPSSRILRSAWVQIICALLATSVTFTLFPGVIVQLGHNLHPGFGAASVALYFTADQLGRRVATMGLGLKSLCLFAVVVARVAFIPLFIASLSGWNYIISSLPFSILLQAALGFTQGWAVASAFQYTPKNATKYEIEKVQFFLSLSNALGTPVGGAILAVLVRTGSIAIF